MIYLETPSLIYVRIVVLRIVLFTKIRSLIYGISDKFDQMNGCKAQTNEKADDCMDAGGRAPIVGASGDAGAIAEFTRSK